MDIDHLKSQHTDLVKDFVKHEAVCEERWGNINRRMDVLFKVIERTDNKIDRLLWKFAGIGIACSAAAVVALKVL